MKNKIKELEKKAFPKNYSKRFDKFTSSLPKKQYFEFMALNEIRGKQIELVVLDTKEKTVKEVLKLIKAWDGYGDERFPNGELKELLKEIKKIK